MSGEKDKKVRGGKRAGTLRDFIPNDAGIRTEGLGGGKPTKLGFEGSGLKPYTFTRVINGIPFTRTITAHNVVEANRLAAIEGFKTSDRQLTRKKKRKS